MSQVIAFVGRIAIAEEQKWLTILQTSLPNCEIRIFSDLTEEEKTQCRLAIVANPELSKLKELPNLVWVHSVWAGVDAMLTDLSNDGSECGFDIVRLVDPNLATTMSEAVLAWSLYLHRDMPTYQKLQQQKEWLQQAYVSAPERTIGILGLGKLGQLSAERLSLNGFNVMGWSRQLKSLNGVHTVAGDDGLAQLLVGSDIIINLLPLTQATTGLLNYHFFEQCKRGASLINFGRGATVVEEDVILALDNGLLSHAVLDVFEQEPLTSSHPFWAHGKITVLPHISAPTSVASASEIVVQNINKYFETGELPPVVDLIKGY